MPKHNWRAVKAGVFHVLHQSYSVYLCEHLNAGLLPDGFFAVPEGRVQGWEPDVLAVDRTTRPPRPGGRSRGPGGQVAVADAPPSARSVSRPQPETEAQAYARRADRVAVRRRQDGDAFGRVVAVIEIVSPGNKVSADAVRAFVRDAADLLDAGVHLLVSDLFPPTARDPAGLYKLIWDHVRHEPFELPPDKPLVLAACQGGPDLSAYVDTAGVGDELPAMPLFLDRESYVNVPLEAAYATTWGELPAEVQDLVLDPAAD